jgi:hypothetical protein
MSLAPEPILRAGNTTVAWACIFIRNQTLREDVPIRMINDAMDAIHAVPGMLIDWRPDTLSAIRNHLGCFPASRWPGAPDLVAFFEQRLKEYGHDEDAVLPGSDEAR